MKKIVILFTTVLLSAGLFAQARLEKGGIQLSAGTGFSGWGIPFYINGEYGVHEDVTVGLDFSYRTYKQKYFGFEYSHNIIGLAAFGNYHFNNLLSIPDPWDVYAGANIGFSSWSTNGTYTGSTSDGIFLGTQVGGRYYFSENFGVQSEIALTSGTSGLRVGITFKL